MRSRSAVRETLAWILHILGVSLLAASLASAQAPSIATKPPPLPTDVQELLSWLPHDTETVIVANKPSLLPGLVNFQKNPELFTKEVAFEMMALTPLWFKNGSLSEYFKKETVTVALQGSRRFRPSTGFGPMFFQGCAVVIFANSISDRWNLFFRESVAAVLKMEEIDQQKLLVFREKLPDGAVWTTFVAHPRPNVLIVGTDLDYVREVLSRIRGSAGTRALPEALPQWMYVDTSAQFWGVRHYSRAQTNEDPSSPIGRREMAQHYGDGQAIGLVFSFDPAHGKGPVVSYLSDNHSISSQPGRSILSMGYEGKKLAISYRELNAGVLEASYNLEAPGAVFIFSFYLGWMLGHGIFV